MPLCRGRAGVHHDISCNILYRGVCGGYGGVKVRGKPRRIAASAISAGLDLAHGNAEKMIAGGEGMSVRLTMADLPKCHSVGVGYMKQVKVSQLLCGSKILQLRVLFRWLCLQRIEGNIAMFTIGHKGLKSCV